MPLIDDVKKVCRDLAPAGWAELLKEFGLDIRAADLATELGRSLPKLRPGARPNVSGFEDLDPRAGQGIEPGVPDRSLLYHALASPNVRKRPDGTELGAFPTLRQLDVVENYVYGVRPPTVATLRARANAVQRGAGTRLAVVVFASEYRPGGQTVHETWAGTCFARTGVARIGTAGPRYSPRERGFQPAQPGRPQTFCVLPARYSAYVAFQHRGPAPGVFGPLRSAPEVDGRLRFWVPLHKLFSGTECLRGKTLAVRLTPHHVNDKLARVHAILGPGNTNLPNPVVNAAPFRFEDGIAELGDPADFGEGLLVPVPHGRLVKAAATADGRLVGYKVPRGATTLSSSFAPPEAVDGAARVAPEYIHARHELLPDGSIRNLNSQSDPKAAVERGGYVAVHYLDFTGDGWIEPSCPELAGELDFVAAYSLVTAPDFYFCASQRDLMDWTTDEDNVIEPIVPSAVKEGIWRIEPSTLSDVQDANDRSPLRLAPNLSLTGSGFGADDVTIAALVALPLRDRVQAARRDPQEPNRHACLPDAASGAFEPGWDVSLGKTNGVEHLAAYGLGSPFPEDAKLCAALSTFWPAVAPDAARIFEPDPGWPTVAPMTDDEIGIEGDLPYDGYRGPRLLAGAAEVEYQSFAHADYVESALEEKFTAALTSRVDSDEYRRRVAAMARVYRMLNARTVGQKAKWAVLSFRDATPADGELRTAQSATGVPLAGRIRRFQVYQHGASRSVPGGRVRVQVRAGTMTIVYLDAERLLVNRNQGGWEPVVG